MGFEEVTPELKEKAIACKTTSELIELAKEEGMELTDEQLDAISGGIAWNDVCEWKKQCSNQSNDSHN